MADETKSGQGEPEQQHDELVMLASFFSTHGKSVLAVGAALIIVAGSAIAIIESRKRDAERVSVTIGQPNIARLTEAVDEYSAAPAAPLALILLAKENYNRQQLPQARLSTTPPLPPNAWRSSKHAAYGRKTTS